MKLNLISKSLVIALSATSLVACDSNDDSSQLPPANLQFSFGLENTKEIANNNNIPMPNDLYFIGADGVKSDNLIFFGCGDTNKGAVPETNIENATKCSLEDLDGWSTTAPFTLPMSGDTAQLDNNTFASSIRIFEKRTLGYGELKYDDDFTVRVTEFNHLQILPLKPLASDKQYILAITNSLASRSGDLVKRSISFDSLLTDAQVTIEPLTTYKAKVEGLISELASQSITAENVLYIAGIKTQNIGQTLTSLAATPYASIAGITSDSSPTPHLAGAGLPSNILDQVVGGIIGKITPTDPADPIEPAPFDPELCNGGPFDIALECVRKLPAKIELPYYLDDSMVLQGNCTEDSINQENAEFWFAIDGINVKEHESYFESYRYSKDTCEGLYSNWNIDNASQKPIDSATQILDVQVVLPKEPTRLNPYPAEPSTGWPVIIFSHGITAAKEFGNGGMLLLDNFVQTEFAKQGYVVIAIDHPLHNSRAVDFNPDGDTDSRNDTYEINASQSLRGLFAGNDSADVKNYLKAGSLLTSRDNLRQSIADLINLRASIGEQIFYTDNSDPLNPTQVQVPLDSDNVYVMGHSMGSIAAASFSGIAEGTQTDINGTILANPGAGIAGILMNSVWLGHSEVPPAIKALPEYRLRMAKELGLEYDLDAVRQYAEQNPAAYKQKSDQISPEYLSEFQYLIQAVVDTVDPINYTAALKNKPILSLTVTGSISEQPELKNSQGNLLTTADQTVPIKVELDGQTTYAVCNQASAVAGDVASQDLGCFNGSSFKPYYSLDNTEFPLSGAGPLETQLGLRNVLNSTERSYTRFLTGTHNIGAGTLTGSETEGNADYASVDSAATELTIQAASFVEYTLGSADEYIQGTNRVAPEDLTIIEIEK